MRIILKFVALTFFSACGGELELTNLASEKNTTINITTEEGNDVASNCGVDELICRGTCTNIRTNQDHCGACGDSCTQGTCVDSQCVDSSGEVIDAMTNNSTNTNNATNTTHNETIVTPKPDCSFEICGSECIDTSRNVDHCGTCNNACGGAVCQNGSCASLGEVEGILAATNRVRAAGTNCGAYGPFAPTSALTLDPELNKAAQVHAQDMADNRFFDHTGSDGSSFATRIGRTAFSGQPIGENIAAGGSQPSGIVDRWVDSDGHCRNLMNPQASKLGVGYSVGGQYGTLWVQVFAR